MIWYDECLLRYSSEFIFSAETESPEVSTSDDQNATDPGRFDDVVASSLNDATNQAVSLAKRFSTNEANVSRLQTLYSLVQCTPGLSSPDCNRCSGKS
ncbi:hypothetical protein SLEP1_g46655 [Rubroshorea leprosula]|uniref:Gnk2-homologous domain-containing protein n=1 Tax=Rubroshorea leprosula TaxID=152421 RepID=A0AAV5LQE2_9ROSI|nr:hypothetical protein SLEP1_g46655 [Rubroshorea leprosula]